MNCYVVKINDKDYMLRLSVRNIINLEKKMNMNPLSVFTKMGENELPKIEDMMIVFHESLQYQVKIENQGRAAKGEKQDYAITFEDAESLYDEYMDEGKTYVEFIQLIMEIFKVSGLFKEETSKGKKAKN